MGPEKHCLGFTPGCKHPEWSKRHRKSTILNNSVRRLSDLEGGALSNGIHLGVSFTFYPEDATYIHFDVIRSFDRPLLSSGLLEKSVTRMSRLNLTGSFISCNDAIWIIK